MISKNCFGKKSIKRSISLFLILIVVLIYIFYFMFSQNKSNSSVRKYKEPVQIATKLTKNENNDINVDLQRYYSSLELLDSQKTEYTYVLNEINKEFKDLSSEYLLDSTISNPQVSLDLNVKEDSIDEILSVESQFNNEQPINNNESLLVTTNETTDNIDEFNDIPFEEDLWEDDWGDDWDSSELLPPVLFDPLIQTQEEYDMFNPDISYQPSYEDDSFFDDFYVSGGEVDVESLYPDGAYYLLLYIGDNEVGEIKVTFNKGVYSLDVDELKQFLSPRLGDKSFNRIFNAIDNTISIEELNDRGVDSSIDINQFAVFLKFSLSDIPLVIVPVSKVDNSTSALKNNQYGINDAELIKPEFISLVTSNNLYLSYSYGPKLKSLNPLNSNLFMNNSLQVGKIEFNFTNSLSYNRGSIANPFNFNLGSWSGNYQFYDKNLVLKFGQVGGNLLSSGTPIGFIIEKSYSNGLQKLLPNQFSKTYKVVDKAKIEIVLNGEVILAKNVNEGEYKFVNFTFKDGGNKIIFNIDYIDESLEDIYQEFEVAYASELFAEGDYLWGLSASINKSEINNSSKTIFALPYFDGKWYEYNFNNLEMKYWFDMGITDSFTLKTSLSLASEILHLSFNGILATMNGPYYGSLSTYVSDGVTPSLKGTLSHVFITNAGPISANLTFNAPVFNTTNFKLSTPFILGLSVGYTFKFINFPPINTSFNISASQYGLSGASSIATSYSPGEGISFASSLSASKSYNTDLNFSLQMSLNYALRNNLSTSTSFSNKGNSNVGISLKASDRDSFQMSISNIQYVNNEEPSYNGSWTHNGDLSNISMNQFVSGDLQEYTTSIGLSSNLYFANGLFALSSKAANNFFLVKPTGKLAQSDISISQTNDSSPKLLKNIFGVSVYTDLVSNTKNNLIIYGDTDSIFSSGGTFSYQLNTYGRSGFTKIVTIPTSYTVSGVLRDAEDKAISQYSSPVYSREIDDNGKYYLQIRNDLYLFTDSSGRWILNDVKPGYYVFDLQVDKDWYGISFQIIDDLENEGKVIEIEDYKVEKIKELEFSFDTDLFENPDTLIDKRIYDAFGTEIAQEYDKMVFLDVNDILDETAFYEKTLEIFSQTRYDEAVGFGDNGDEEFVDPFADTATDWVDDDSYSF